jgi:hypothetical protein
MSRLTTYTRLSLPAILLGLSALAAPGSLRAQSATAPKVFYACYVPSSGTTYRIKEIDLKQVCSKSTHVQFSWTDGNPVAVSRFFTVESPIQPLASQARVLAEQACPAGSQVAGGGYRIFNRGGTDFPFVVESRPSADGTGWAVHMFNTAATEVSLSVVVRCAS